MNWLAPFLLASASCMAALVENPVTYDDHGTELEGFHVYDDAIDGPRPAVLIVHQWTGLTDYEKGRARQLAELGYNVLAADIYGKGIRPQPPESGKVAGTYKGDRALYRSRLTAGLDVLKADERTLPDQVAAIGYCFGGTGVLELARSGADLAGVVSFHGGLDAAEGFLADSDTLKAKILVCHGAEDPHVPSSQIQDFHHEMEQAGADWLMVSYGHAVHAFTQPGAGNDPSKGAAYNEAADRRSWQQMKDFFAEIFHS
ncbi:dienelactone hydrolase [Haloferula luteola]|uniref:Dienelactone hydrolase n=1 Tax=Haloferula luteola TaxID=595692 RepID=A0A840UZ81_9BACT|nr:dienelactone hydrolase family protein [Haloferula luteola]MBB5351427.1 dienelactone hydrolase [Haloferula luteola]